LRERKKSIPGFLFLGPEDIKISLGAIRNFRKEQGFPELRSDYGAQRALS
jgi:hypothetical protein